MSRVRHFCPPGFDPSQILEGIRTDLARDKTVGIVRCHEFHPHEKGEICNLDECRRIELEGGDTDEASLTHTSLDLDIGSVCDSNGQQPSE